MKSTLLITFTALILALSEGASPRRFFSGGTTQQHGRPTPTPTPRSPGPVSPGDIGGPHRIRPATEAAASPTSNTEAAAPAATPIPDPNTFRMREYKASRKRSRHLTNASDQIFGTYLRLPVQLLPPCEAADRLRDELSGIYFGDIDFDELGLRGTAKLTICNGQFTLVSGEKKASGIISSVRTSRYTAAAFRFTEFARFEHQSLSWPKSVSVTVLRSERSFSFRSAPGEPSKFSFAGFRVSQPKP
jgi:hypothetical protein